MSSCGRSRTSNRNCRQRWQADLQTRPAAPGGQPAQGLGVSASGDYARLKRAPAARARADAALGARIAAVHQGSRATYGAPRIHAELAAEGFHGGRKRVARLMNTAGLYGVSRRHSALDYLSPIDYERSYSQQPVNSSPTSSTKPG